MGARTIAARNQVENRLQQALHIPIEIRSELCQCEQDVSDELVEEAKSKQVAATICGELEDLHYSAAARLRERNAEVETLQREVQFLRYTEQELAFTLARQRTALQRQ